MSAAPLPRHLHAHIFCSTDKFHKSLLTKQQKQRNVELDGTLVTLKILAIGNEEMKFWSCSGEKPKLTI